jgi:hypothetical protein
MRQVFPHLNLYLIVLPKLRYTIKEKKLNGHLLLVAKQHFPKLAIASCLANDNQNFYL